MEKEKETREYLKRTLYGFICEKHGGEIRLQYKKISNNQYNKEHPDNPDSCKDHNYHFICNNENCCEREFCPNKHIVETQTPLMYSMRLKFAQKRYIDIYKDICNCLLFNEYFCVLCLYGFFLEKMLKI